MRNIHALIRKLLLRVRHPDEVRGNRSDPVAKRVFGLADPVQSDQDLRVRPTLDEVQAFRDLPDDEQLYCLNTYLRMAVVYSDACSYPENKFVLTIHNGRIRYAKSNSGLSDRKFSKSPHQYGGKSIANIFVKFLKNFFFKTLEIVSSVRKAAIYRNGKDDI